MEAASDEPALRVRGTLLAWTRDDPAILAAKVSPVNREYLLQSEPEIFFLTPHYRNHPIVLVRLSQIGRARLAEVLEDGSREVAWRRLQADYDQRRKGAKRRAP